MENINISEQRINLAEKLLEMSIESILKRYEDIIQAYVFDKEYYIYAYNNSKPYKKFIDESTEDFKKAIKKVHRLKSASSFQGKFYKGVLAASTFGLSLGAEALGKKALKSFGKKSKKDIIIRTVDDEGFDVIFEVFNEVRNLEGDEANS